MSGKSVQGTLTRSSAASFAVVTLVLSVVYFNFGKMSLNAETAFPVPGTGAAQQPFGTDVSTTASHGAEEKRAAPLAQRTFRIQTENGRIKLRGSVASGEEQKVLLGIVAASFPGVAIQDRTKIDATNADVEGWLSGVSFALRQLSLMRNGNAVLRGHTITLTGHAATTEAYKSLQGAMLEMPNGFKLSEDSSVNPPSSAYVWLANYYNGALNLGGHVPNEIARERILGYAEALFPDIKLDNETTVAKGAPKNWAEAVYISLRALKFLRNGSASLSDHTIRIEGFAADPEMRRHIEALSEALPEGFNLESDVLTPQQTETTDIPEVSQSRIFSLQ